MSYDGQFMWFLATNQGGGSPNVRRARIDGTELEMHPEFGDAHHDLVVLPDESVGFFQYYMNGRDRLMEREPDGMLRQVIDVPTAHGGTTNNHANSIQYFAADESYTFSDLDQNCYVKVSRQGQVAWVLGGSTSDFTGAGATWTREHGHQLLAPNRLLFFNNGSQGADCHHARGHARHDRDDRHGNLAVRRKRETATPSATCSACGTATRSRPTPMPAPSTKWMRAEPWLQSLSFSVSGGIGYSMKRQSLYGPPPKQTGF